MTGLPTIEVATEAPRVVIGGLSIIIAPTVGEMYAVLGRPSRIDSGETPAPVGHRNNQIHVYDHFGLVFHEHHYTRRAQGVWCWFDVSDSSYSFAPHQPIRGRLVFDGVAMPQGGRDIEFSQSSPFEFTPDLGNIWRFAISGFTVFLHSHGPKLPSGQRSKVRRVTDVSISSPHDKWGEPAVSSPTPP